MRPRLILEGQLKCLIWKMTFKCHYSWFYIIHKVQWHNWNLLLIHLLPFSHFFKYFSKKHNLIWPYFECFKVSKLINLLEFTLILIFGWILQVFYVPFLSSFYLQNGGYLTTETNVEWNKATLTMEWTTYQKLLKMLHRIPKTLAISTTN